MDQEFDLGRLLLRLNNCFSKKACPRGKGVCPNLLILFDELLDVSWFDDECQFLDDSPGLERDNKNEEDEEGFHRGIDGLVFRGGMSRFLDEPGFVFGQASGELEFARVFFKESCVKNAGGKVCSFLGRVTAIAGIEFFAECGILLSNNSPGRAHRSKVSPAFSSGGLITLTEGFLHGLIGWEKFFVHFVSVASTPGFVEDGLGPGVVDDFV